MALALEQVGVPPATAVAAAVAFHALETAASLLFGSTGWLALRSAGAPTRPRIDRERSEPEVRVRPWPVAATTRAPDRGRAGRAAGRARHPMGARASRLRCGTLAGRHDRAGAHTRPLPPRRRRVQRVHRHAAGSREPEEPERAEARPLFRANQSGR
jgi:hypothetical protein